MITSLKFNGKYNVGVNTQNAIAAAGVSVKLADIPFVRYNFESYGSEEIDFITKNMEKFNKSTHLVQINLNDNTEASINNLKVASFIDKVAKFLYMSIDQADMDTDSISDTKLEAIESAKNTAIEKFVFDRIMLIDNTRNLDMVHANRFMNSVAKKLNVNKVKVGLCSSPLCCNSDLCCLTAVKAREIMTTYGNAEAALPSANHQSMNTCGCIRYFEVNEDIAAPAVETKKKTLNDFMNPAVESDGTETDKVKKTKTNKEPKAKKSSGPKMDAGYKRIQSANLVRSLF